MQFVGVEQLYPANDALGITTRHTALKRKKMNRDGILSFLKYDNNVCYFNMSFYGIYTVYVINTSSVS